MPTKEFLLKSVEPKGSAKKAVRSIEQLLAVITNSETTPLMRGGAIKTLLARKDEFKTHFNSQSLTQEQKISSELSNFPKLAELFS